MKSYSQYKDSTVAWIGIIPKHWKVFRLKNCINLITEKKSNSYRKVGLENIDSWTGNFIETSTTFETEGIFFLKGDVLFGKLRPYLAKLWIAPFEGEAIGDFFVFRCENIIINTFLKYLILNKYAIDEINSSTFGVKMPRVNWEWLSNFNVTLPPLPEQQAIVDYLDHETAEMDALITEQEELISLLKQKRSAIISEAVCRGLDPTVSMKDSDVGWLGSIPKHWKTSFIKYNCTMQSGESITSKNIKQQGQYPVYGANGLRGYTNTYTHTGYHVLIGRQGALCGNVNQVDNIFYASEHAIVVEPFSHFNARYSVFLFSAMNLGQYSIAAAQPGISVERILSIKMPIPPLLEQQAIVDYLDRETTEIGHLIADCESSIQLLKQRRTALISEAVTGKIDVRTA